MLRGNTAPCRVVFASLRYPGKIQKFELRERAKSL
jgi:hypothetical protein